MTESIEKRNYDSWVKRLSSFEHFIQDLRIISLHTWEIHKKVPKMILLELANWQTWITGIVKIINILFWPQSETEHFAHPFILDINTTTKRFQLLHFMISINVFQDSRPDFAQHCYDSVQTSLKAFHNKSLNETYCQDTAWALKRSNAWSLSSTAQQSSSLSHHATANRSETVTLQTIKLKKRKQSILFTGL